MEDYKKKYEDALERAIKWASQPTVWSSDDICQKIFPELQESEDERIRKGIIEYLEQSQFGEEHYLIDDDIVRGYISWLEKQDPKKHEEELERAYKCADEVQYRKGYEDAKREFEKQGEQSKQNLYDIIIALWNLLDKIDTFSDLQIDDTNPDNPFRKIEHITQERHKFVKSDGYNLYIQGEQITDFKQSKQKPADKCIGCNNFKGCITCTDGDQYAHITEQKTTDKIKPKKKLKNIKQTYFQKQEWTGYDEKAYEIALLDIDKSPSITKNDTIDWLKSLKNRVQTKPKQEWSEKDENMLQKAISTIMYALSIPIGKENDPCFVGSSTISWLKSLKERNTWKPSDRQMKQLGWVTEQNKDNALGKELMTLYQDLKKLREE